MSMELYHTSHFIEMSVLSMPAIEELHGELRVTINDEPVFGFLNITHGMPFLLAD